MSKKPKDVKGSQALVRKERIPYFSRLVGKVKPSKKIYKREKPQQA